MSEENATAQGQEDIQFALQRIYVKDVSFEAPNSPSVFQQQFQPRVKLDVDNSYTQVDEGVYEVTVKVTAQVFNGEQQTTAFLVEVEQAGLFTIMGLPDAQLDHTLNAFCPNVLFPYARECIDNMVGRGSFPALMLAPVNFDAMYAQKQQGNQQAAN
ncbi:protein-export chaperone SecB [Larsenimonas rhizosphaerae]|uniref:Protein-export protein SecB n=1 Tax=Larsenimonas rhizosphaerae TaxID=2944682 RepID=A0AA41ZH13_9GAMM|nr:protein-export chaperone SecB [Larsenimonas rhizosphaerae]MCM2129341.1 protein-export chaperone SecB [Larsenimonas rhizosphaerae]MCX2523994.1 protein-export chaperone SecB [Larsenimonas rhizosphaerae]